MYEIKEENADIGEENTNIDMNLDHIINEFKQEAGGLENEERQNEFRDESISNENVEGISYNDLFDLCPPSIIQNVLNPSQWLAYKELSKNLEENQAIEIKSYFESSPKTLEIKKEIVLKILDQYFPSMKGKKVSPLMSFALMEIVLTTNSMINARKHLQEEAFLKGGKNES